MRGSSLNQLKAWIHSRNLGTCLKFHMTNLRVLHVIPWPLGYRDFSEPGKWDLHTKCFIHYLSSITAKVVLEITSADECDIFERDCVLKRGWTKVGEDVERGWIFEATKWKVERYSKLVSIMPLLSGCFFFGRRGCGRALSEVSARDPFQ